MLAAYWELSSMAQLSANYTLTRATFRGGVFDGNTIPGVPRNRFGTTWRADWMEGFSTTLYLTYVGSSFLLNDQPNVLDPVESYLLLDVAATYRWRDIEAFARIDNLTGRKYVSTGTVSPSSGAIGLYPASGIAVRGGVSYRF
jgi:hypothetical protein